MCVEIRININNHKHIYIDTYTGDPSGSNA